MNILYGQYFSRQDITDEQALKHFELLVPQIYGTSTNKLNSTNNNGLYTTCFAGYKGYVKENMSVQYFAPGVIISKTLKAIDDFNNICKNIHIEIIKTHKLKIHRVLQFGKGYLQIFSDESGLTYKTIDAEIPLFKITRTDKIPNMHVKTVFWLTCMYIRLLAVGELFVTELLDLDNMTFPDNFGMKELLALNNRCAELSLGYRSLSEVELNNDDIERLDAIYKIYSSFDGTQTQLWKTIKTIRLPSKRFRILVKIGEDSYGYIGLNWKHNRKFSTLEDYLAFYVRNRGAIFGTEETFQKIKSRAFAGVTLEKYAIEDNPEPNNS